MVVFTIAGNATIYVAKVGESGQSCAGTGTTSSDATFSTSCNGHTYDTTTVNHGSRDGVLVTPYTTSPCPGLFTVGNNAIQAAGNVTILFSVGHAGAVRASSASTARRRRSPATPCSSPAAADLISLVLA